MIAVSNAWKQKQDELLAPEGFVEISYLLAVDGVQEDASASSTAAADFASTADIVDTTSEHASYASNELNSWVLDGSREILPDSPPGNTGYVGSEFGAGSVTISLGSTRTELLPGVTITWSEAYGEYATDFTVTVKRGTTVVATQKVTGNNSVTSVVKMTLYRYDTVEITVNEWCLPDRRPRIEEVQLGYMVTFGKSDITKYSHTQKVCLSSGELPKNSISFSLDNSTGRWNPNSPDGMERYLADRQRMKVRYGCDIDGHTEWIKAGTFYLSEWKTPANGMEASFEARDLLEYMIDEPYTGIRTGTLYEIAANAIGMADLPYGASVYLSPVLQDYSADFSDNDNAKTIAEVLQLCANASCCVMYQDRNGVLRVERATFPQNDFTIRQRFEFTHPDFELSKPLARVTVEGGSDPESKSLSATSDGNGTVSLGLSGQGDGAVSYTLEVASTGETQTVSNELISTVEQAAEVAEWIAANLETRKTVSGEWRADPRFDALDNITMESKFGTVLAVWLQEVTYSFSGAFRGSFKGYVPKRGNVIEYYTGELFCGEVV